MTPSTRRLSAEPWADRADFDIGTEIGPLGVLDPETVRRARLAVAGRAVDAAEAAVLLAMLGLGGGV